MGSVTSNKVVCAECGQLLSESTGILPEQCTRCTNCGSTKRNHSISINETLKIQGSLIAKGRHEGKKKPFFEMFSGANWSYDFKKWMQKLRIFHWDNDYYKEEVIDPDTNVVIHYDEGKLSEHTGHGSAKKKNK